MITKIFLSILIFFIVYILMVFNMPNLSGAIGKVLGLEKFNEYILTFKGKYDETVTKIPSQNEITNVINTVQSGAIEFKDNFDLGVDYTKDKIDGIRENISGAEKNINEIKNGYDGAIKYVNSNSGKIQEVKDVINSLTGITENLSNTGTINGIKNTVEKVTNFTNDLTSTGNIN